MADSLCCTVKLRQQCKATVLQLKVNFKKRPPDTPIFKCKTKKKAKTVGCLSLLPGCHMDNKQATQLLKSKIIS